MTDLKLFPIQARWFLLLWLIPLIWDPTQRLFDAYLVEKILANSVDGVIPDYFFDLSFYYQNSAREIILIVFCALVTRTSLGRFVSPFDKKMLAPSLEITLFTFFASSALIYITFYPLSFVAPNFIQFWFIDLPPIVYSVEGALPFWPNALSLFSLAVLAPLTEEFIFRGIFLQRWGSKHGSKTAILLSSAIFAYLHSDPFGAFLFALLMCYLTIRSGGILLPIVCHALYNAGIWCLALIEQLIEPGFIYTLADFQSEWPYAIAFIIISIIWAVRLHAKIPAIDKWKIPVLYSRP